MQNYAIFGFGSNINTIVGYAMSSTDRIGPVMLEFENLGPSATLLPQATNVPGGSVAKGTATVAVKQFVNNAWAELIPPFTVVPGGRVQKNIVLQTRKIGFFGSGNAMVAVSIPVTQASALRGGHIDIEIVGRTNWGAFDAGVDSKLLFGGTNS